MDLYEQIKEKYREQIKLIDELKYSQQVESGEITHEIKQQGGLYNEKWGTANYYYHLIDPNKGEIVCSGNKLHIRSYCRLRNIDIDKIK